MKFPCLSCKYCGKYLIIGTKWHDSHGSQPGYKNWAVYVLRPSCLSHCYYLAQQPQLTARENSLNINDLINPLAGVVL